MRARNPGSSDTAGAARTGARRRFSLRPLRERGGSVRTPKPHDTRPGRESSEETATVPVEQAAQTAPRLPAWLRRLGYYGLALLLVAVAALLRWALSDVLQPAPTLVFYLAWVGAAAFGGLGPGLLATLASWLCIEFLFDPTPGQINFANLMSVGRLVVMLAGGLVISVVGEKMRRSRIRERRQGRELRVANAALRASEAGLAKAQAIAHLANWEVDIRANAVRGSHELYRLFNLEPDLTLDAYVKKFHPEDRLRAVAAIEAAIYEGKPCSIDYRIVPRPGEVRHVHAEGEVIRDKNGAPLTFFGTVQDITERTQAEEALRESEEKYRRIVETVTEGIAMADAEARMIFVNDRWSEIFGYSPEEATHVTLFDLVFPEDAARMKERWESRKRGQKERYEWRYRRKDGRPIWVLASVAPRFGPAGEFLGTLVLNTDITERKQAEEALRENEARLRVALDAGRMGTWVWDLATDTVDTDPLHRRLWDLDDTDVRVPARVILEKVHPADRGRVFGQESAQQMASEPFDIEFRVVRRDGSTRWLLGSAVPIRDGDGVLQKVIGVNFDITERKDAEEALRESEGRLRFIVENSPDTILIQDRDLRYVWISQPAYPLTHEELLGHTDLEILLPEDAARLTEIKQRVLAEGQRLTVEVPMTWEGQKRFYEATYEPWRDAEGSIIGVAGYVRDITERKRVEESLRELTATLESKVARRTEELEQRARQLQKLTLELSEAEEQERKRVAEILHDDLQQVLAAAKFHLSRVGSGTGSPEQSQPIVEQVKQMLKDAIEKSRHLSHDLSPAVLRQGDLAETFDWLAEQMQAKHGLTVHVEAIGAAQAHSDAVKALMYRSAQEMLFNVVKHAQVSEARLRVRRRGRYICLSVSDRGRGFDPGEIQKTAGFGLLNIRERVALLGGRMKTRSARGRGTTFRVVVPDAGPPANDVPVERESNSLALPDHSR